MKIKFYKTDSRYASENPESGGRVDLFECESDVIPPVDSIIEFPDHIGRFCGFVYEIRYRYQYKNTLDCKSRPLDFSHVDIKLTFPYS